MAMHERDLIDAIEAIITKPSNDRKRINAIGKLVQQFRRERATEIARIACDDARRHA